MPGVGEGSTRPRVRRPALGRMSVFVLGLVIGAAIGGLAVFLADPILSTLLPAAAASSPQLPAPQPVPPPAPVQTLRVAAGRPVVIGVFGDSMGDGLWAGLYNQLHDRRAFDVVKFSRASTGLARYDYVDVHDQAMTQLAGRHIDIAVVMVGANDEQGISQGRQVYDFGSPGWQAIYTRRIDDLVALFRQNGAAVYWVGLPKMRRAAYDQKAQLLNALYQARAQALGAPFIPTVAETVDGHGDYNDYLVNGAGPQLMRDKDGVHMTLAGYIRIAAPVAGLIQADVNRATIARQNQAAGAGLSAGAGAAPAQP